MLANNNQINLKIILIQICNFVNKEIKKDISRQFSILYYQIEDIFLYLIKLISNNFKNIYNKIL